MSFPDGSHTRRPTTYRTTRPATYRTIITGTTASGPSVHSTAEPGAARPRLVVPPGATGSSHARPTAAPDTNRGGDERGDNPLADRWPSAGPRRTTRLHPVDSDCLIGISDPQRPDIVRARNVDRGGHPHDMLPTLRRIWSTTGGNSTRLATALLAHDWLHLDPTAHLPMQPGRHAAHGFTGRRVIAGVGITHAATGSNTPEPVTVVPLAHLDLLDATWLYLLGPATDTVTVHTGDGELVSRHLLYR